ncbi:uncharacterized [Tachysurus ichikawai]
MVTIQHAPELLKENSLQASDSTELKIIVKVKEEPHVLRSETTRTPRRGAVCTQDLRRDIRAQGLKCQLCYWRLVSEMAASQR